MADDFIGSFAQTNVSFSVVEQTTVVPGAQFGDIMVMIGTLDAVNNFVDTPPAAGTAVKLTASDYATTVKGDLLSWLNQFFANTTLASCYVVVFTETATVPVDSATQAAIAAAYSAFKDLAYFKFMYHADFSAQTELAKNCYPDQGKYSQACIGTSDSKMLVSGSEDSESALIKAAGYDAWFGFHKNADVNACMVQLGLTLGYLNGTGTTVSNPVGMTSTTTTTPSGSTGSTLVNLSSTERAVLEGINASFFVTLGDGTGAVTMLGGGKTNNGKYVSAIWFEAYIDYKSAVRTAVLLNTPGAPTWKNNATLNQICNILRTELQPFADIGVISNMVVKSFTTATIPASSGSSVVLPNAWSAIWNRSVDEVTVQGVITIAA